MNARPVLFGLAIAVGIVTLYWLFMSAEPEWTPAVGSTGGTLDIPDEAAGVGDELPPPETSPVAGRESSVAAPATPDKGARDTITGSGATVIRLRVTNDLGRPLSGVDVELSFAPPEQIQPAQLFGTRLRPLETHEIRLKTREDGTCETRTNAWLYGLTVRTVLAEHAEFEKRIRVTNPPPQVLEQDIVLARLGSATIRVVDASGNATDALLRIRPKAMWITHGRTLRLAHARKNAPATFSNVIPGAYIVDVIDVGTTAREKPAYRRTSSGRSKGALDSQSKSLFVLAFTDVEVRAGVTCERTMRLPSLGALELRIVDGSEAFEDGKVVLLAPTHKLEDIPDDIRSSVIAQDASSLERAIGPGGIVRIERVPPGAHRLEVRAGPHALPHAFAITIDDTSASRHHTLDLQSARVDFGIEGGSREHLVGATLHVTRDQEVKGSVIQLAGTSEISLWPLAAGTYVVELRDPDGQALARKRFDVRPRKSSEVRLSLEDTVAVQVRVRDRTGTPTLAFVRVRRKDSDAARSLRIPRGTGAIQLLPGTWLLSARTVPGHPAFGVERELELRAGFDRELEFDLR
ncbi:MAG: hypothetical protein H6832_11390 [Planctomycetes bacterium]|nr:hypothetical protein [Planctomycetota bacterium]MCB9918994.1 hypothetical protein [Planctomycetota bacterium]